MFSTAGSDRFLFNAPSFGGPARAGSEDLERGIREGERPRRNRSRTQRGAQVARRNQEHADGDAAGVAGPRQTAAMTDALPTTARTTLRTSYVRVLPMPTCQRSSMPDAGTCR
jgi:hypothetical protein